MAEKQAQHFHEVTLTIASFDVDPVANYIIENISSGLLLEDEDEDSHTTIKFYTAASSEIDNKILDLKKYLSAVNPAYGNIEITQRTIKELDWIDAYKKSVVPVLVGETIVIKPPWNEESFPGRVEILIEPKMAFGTGRHESTSGSLTMMEKIDFEDKTVLDLGCGSGILSIYAAKRGAREVVGYDIDPQAVENSLENFTVNGAAEKCSTRIGTIDDIPASAKFDVIIVNIIKSVIVPIIGELRAHLAPAGILIFSGLLDQDREEVESALMKNGLTSFSTRSDNEWITYTVRLL